MGAVPDCEDGQKGMEEASAAGKKHHPTFFGGHAQLDSPLQKWLFYV